MAKKPWELDYTVEQQDVGVVTEGPQPKPWEVNYEGFEAPKIPSSSDRKVPQGRVMHAANTAVKSLINDVAGIPEWISIAAVNLSKAMNWESQEQDPTQLAGYKLGSAMRRAAHDLFPQNPEYQDEFLTTTLPGGVGSAVGYIGTMLLTKGMPISTPTLSAFMGASSVSAQEYRNAIEAGASDEDAMKTWIANMPIGASEAIPINRAFSKINKATGNSITKYLKRLITKEGLQEASINGLEEAIQESIQNFATNATARELYDAERKLTEGVAEGGLAGFIIGMGLNGLGGAVNKRITKTKSIEESVEQSTNKAMLEIDEELKVFKPDKDTPVLGQLDESDAAHIRDLLKSKFRQQYKDYYEALFTTGYEEEFKGVGRDRAPLPMPPIHDAHLVSDSFGNTETQIIEKTTMSKDEQALVKRAWDILSTRYPASMKFVKSIDYANTDNYKADAIAYMGSENGNLGLNKDYLASLVKAESKSELVPAAGTGGEYFMISPISDLVSVLGHEVTHAVQKNKWSTEAWTKDFFLPYYIRRTEREARAREEGIREISMDAKNKAEAAMDEFVRAQVEAQAFQDKELAIRWALQSVSESDWLKFLKGEQAEPPVALHRNYGKDIKSETVDEKLQDNVTDDQYESAVYRKPDTISAFAQKFLFPEKVLAKRVKEGKLSEAPMFLSGDIIRAQLEMVHHEKELEAWWKKLSHGLDKEGKIQVREAMEYAYDMRNEDLDADTKAASEKALADLYAKNPKIKDVIEGVDSRGGLIELFEYEKKRFQDSLRQQYVTELDPEMYDYFWSVVDGGKTVEQVVNEDMSIERAAEELYYRKAEERNGQKGLANAVRRWNAQPNLREKKIKQMKKKQTKRLSKLVKDYTDISKWGVKDFQTRIEVGNYRITDEEGKTVAWAQNVKDAKEKAARIRQQEFEETGIKPKPFNIDPELSRIDPTKGRKDVLEGEVDIFDSLPRYIHAMEKRITMAPIVARFKAEKKADPGNYTPDVNSVIQQQINAVMGSNYEWMERVIDEYAISRGATTGQYRKYVGLARTVQAWTKIGARMSAVLVNAQTGFGMTYVSTGARFWQKAFRALHQGEYKAPNGDVVNIQEVIKELEKQGQLGVDFAVAEDGTLSTRAPIWHPLRAFQWVEGPIRRHGFVANYMVQREVFEKNHEDAVWLALQGVRFQQSTYNTAAIPEILRSPSGKLLGQFKSFMINQMQFWSSLNKAELVRMLEVQMLLAGPRGLVYFLKSIPIIGAMGLLDDLEKEVTEDDLPGKLSRGLTGIAGVDLSAPATFQFPNEAGDWLGPTVKDIMTLFRDVVIPGAQNVGAHLQGDPLNAPNFVDDNVIKWAKGLAPISYYWEQLWKSTIQDDFELGEHWVRDSSGNKAYEVSGVWDRLMLGFGAKLDQASEAQALEQQWKRRMDIRAKNRRTWLNKVTNDLLTGKDIDKETWQDAALYGIDLNVLPTRFMWAEMPPKDRAILKARLLDRAEAVDHFNFEEVRRLDNE